MKTIINLAAGLTGAVALNLLHESAKRLDHQAPRVDLIGEEALFKTMKAVGIQPPTGNALFTATLAADLLSNALYYSLIGVGKKKHVVLRGLAYGTAAGLGAVVLPAPLGLRDAPVTRTPKTKVLTVAWYLFGGLVTALSIQGIRNYKN
jgi:hypothetical protein